MAVFQIIQSNAVRFLLIAAIAVFLLGAGVYWFYTVEDAYISFRYCDHFLEGNGLVYNPGEKVEGYTHFLWIIVISLHRLILPFPMAGKIPGVLAGILLIITLNRWSRFSSSDRLSGPLAGLIVAVCPGIQMWAVSGLETLLFAAALTAAFASHYKQTDKSRFLSGVLFGLATLTRPEGILFFTIFVLTITIQHEKGLKRWHYYLFGYCVILIPHILFRYAYYNAWIPNTFWVKSRRFQGGGLAYFKRYAAMTGVFGLLIAVAGLRNRKVRQDILPLVTTSAGYLAYVYYIGGDWMPYGRFLIPAVPLIALASSRTVICTGSRLFQRLFCGMLIAGMVISATSASYDLLRFRLTRYKDVLNWEWTHMKDWKKVAIWLKDNYPETTYLSTGLAGIIPYYSGFRTLDRGGLNDREIASIIHRSVSVEDEKDRIHKIILRRKPDIVMIEELSFSMLQDAPISRSGLPSGPVEFSESFLFHQVRIDGKYFAFYARHPGRLTE